MINVHVMIPSHLHPQTEADRKVMAAPMADWVRDHAEHMARVAYTEKNPGAVISAVQFRGVSSIAVPRLDGEDIPDNATLQEQIVLKRRKLQWRATFLVGHEGKRLPVEPMDEGEIVRRAGRLD